MNRLLALVLLVIIGLGASALFFYWSPTKQAESTVIALERNSLVKSRDAARIKNDPVFARGFEMRVRHLDYLLARAYTIENLPDAAIAVLKKMINDEETRAKDRTRRRSRSCMEEASFYGALREAYALKEDRTGTEQADQRREQLIAAARMEKNREQLEEGISLRLLYGD